LTDHAIKVVDGDTMDVRLDDQVVHVRYIGVNTPETKHPTEGVEPCGLEASEANRKLVEGKAVRLGLDGRHWDPMRPPRLLAHAHLGDLIVNSELVRQGYAQVATYLPNMKYQDDFLTLQRDASAARVRC